MHKVDKGIGVAPFETSFFNFSSVNLRFSVR